VELCRHLNGASVRYVIVGGFAVLHHGYVRATVDIDVLTDPRERNIACIKEAMLFLPDQAIREVRVTDVAEYTVVRVADEVVVDLMGNACGVTYEEVQDSIEYDEINGVRIPYLTAEALLRTKQSLRPQDVQDRLFLEQLIREKKEGK